MIRKFHKEIGQLVSETELAYRTVLEVNQLIFDMKSEKAEVRLQELRTQIHDLFKKIKTLQIDIDLSKEEAELIRDEDSTS